MSDYIDREKFIKLLVNRDLREISTKTIGECLDKAEVADVVEVVRCKDCKEWDAETHSCNIRDSYGWDYKPTDYCSYGEKKDESDTVDND